MIVGKNIIKMSEPKIIQIKTDADKSEQELAIFVEHFLRWRLGGGSYEIIGKSKTIKGEIK